jgi:predicted Zn-dependent protease
MACLFLGSGCDDGNAEAARLQTEAKQYLDQRNFTAAVAPLRKLAHLRPDLPDVFPDLAQSVRHSTEHAALLKEARATLAQNPNDVEALTIAANTLMDGDDEHQKREYERRLVKLRPKDLLFKFTLAQELVNAFQYEEAAPLLDELVKEMPEEAAPLFLRGEATFYRKRDADGAASAASDFQKALERDPHLDQAHLFLGRVYLRQGKPSQAIEELGIAADSMPDDPDIPFEMAKALRAAGQTAVAEKAQAAFVHLREQATLAESMAVRCTAFPQDFALQLKTARLMIQKGDRGRAALYLKHALALRPSDPDALSVAKELEAMGTTRGEP